MILSNDEIKDCFTDLLDEYCNGDLSVTVYDMNTVNKLDSDGRECNIYTINSSLEDYIKNIRSIGAYQSLLDHSLYRRKTITIELSLIKTMTQFSNSISGDPERYEYEISIQNKLLEDIRFCLIRLPEFKIKRITKSTNIIYNIEFKELVSNDYIGKVALESNLSDKDKLVISHNLFEKNNI